MMKRLQLLQLLFCLFSFHVYAQGETDERMELEEITGRLISTCLEESVNDKSVTRYISTIRDDGSFSDVNYTVGNEMASFSAGTHVKRLAQMAIAYRKQESKYHESAELLQKIVIGLDYWYKFQPVSKNWWFNDIGVPQDYMIPLLLLKGKIADEKLLHYSSYLHDATSNKAHKGKNRTWVSNITIYKGCIENNVELVRTGFASIASTIQVVARQGEEGIKIDGSFHQHRPQLYSGGYGLSYASDIAYYLQLVKDTEFEALFTAEKRKIFSNLLLNGHRWFGYREAFDFGVVGRNISRVDGVGNIDSLTLSRMETNEPEHASDYAAWRKHLSGAAFPVSGNRFFWKSDIMVHHGKDYYLSAKVISSRGNGTEMLNNENLLGYNLPLGATNIMTTGKEYQNIFPLWNWNKIPGTTALQHPDSARLYGYHFGKNEFAGGVSNGKNGAIAYEHCYGGVKAQKAYFFLDDVLVCLGADIGSKEPDELVTTVNQCFYSGRMTVGKGDAFRTYKKHTTVENPQWVHHGNIGYLFPAGGEVVLNTQKQTGSWRKITASGDKESVSADVFSLWMSHGTKAVNDTYAYMVVPDKSLDEFQAFVSTQTFTILENSPEVQAVKHENAYIIVFHTPGTLKLEDRLIVSSNRPVLVYMEREGNKYTIGASDPLFRQKHACLTLNQREVHIDFPTGDFVGSTVRVEVAGLQPYELQTEYLKNPLGIDIAQPRLSWKLGDASLLRGRKQTAYQILVASSQQLLNENRADLWESGTVRSAESVNIVYGGVPLKACQSCFWKVRIADEKGQWSDWSSVASWRMGLFAGDWQARWIGSIEMEAQSVGGQKIDNKMPDPWLRKNFVLADVPRDAVVYVASVGYHELYVNGSKVGDAVLSPSVTDHKNRARYMTYDITSYLNPGKNTIALWLGTSWSVFPAYQREDKPAIPMALVQAEIGLAAGKSLRIVSDDTWKVHASPNTLMGYWEAHHFAGEFYDAAREVDGWNLVEFDDSRWASAKVYSPALIVSSDRTEPNRLVEEVKPRSIQEIEPGVYRVDMGINYAGWFEMQIEGEPGDSILFQFSEREKDASSYGIHSIYRMGTKKKATFCNRFNYMTGRWVQISGLRKKPRLEQVRGWMIRPDYRRTGSFECDIPLLNDIYRTTLWTFENLSLGNYVVDCPHRERCGYGGDALATTRMALGNYQMGAFYNKWMEDWRDVQDKDGNLPYTAPTRIGGGGPSWSGYCITLPWEYYRQYGDTRALAENYPTMKRWLQFVETKSEHDMLVRWGGKWSFLGDWLWPRAWPERSAMEKQGKALGDTRETLFFNNCHWIHSLETVAQIADILGETATAAAYRQRAAEVRKAVHSTFFNPADNSYVNGYPSYLAIALLTELPPQSLKEKVWKRLEQEILVNREGHFWGGITAGSYLMHTLLDNGRHDLIFEMATKEDFPGWGYMLKQGLGTLFEDWESRGSGLHSSYLYIGSWFIEALGGIKRPEAGYKHFVIEPWVSEQGPRKVCSSYDSMYGRIVSNWMLKSDTLSVEVVIPANTTAVLKLANVRAASIEEGGCAWKEAEGVTLESEKEDGVALLLQSGSYKFSAKVKNLCKRKTLRAKCCRIR